MKYPYYMADVFTQKIFGGAQIAVFPEAENLKNEQMQLCARELNLSETVFITKKDQSNATYAMRVFNPQHEIDFAGHPTIATAFVLASIGAIPLTDPLTSVIFEQNAGPVEVNISSQKGVTTFIQFTRKTSAIIDLFSPSLEELASFLSITVSEFDNKKYHPRLVSCGFPYLIVPVLRYESVIKARFNYANWSHSSAPQTAAQEILLFAPKTAHPESDFHARLLGSRIGMHEDPPVGNAMPAFASYLCSFEFMQKGTYAFSVDRGVEKIRRSLLNLEMDHKGTDELTLRVGGSAVMVAEGTMSIPD
ncbi:MAG: PhzF family phenazine biosynthesis protein [Methylococcaceae bacterium]|jgi:trans-2,3-dihydro-3-hydroxyanthranilate isomerase